MAQALIRQSFLRFDDKNFPVHTWEFRLRRLLNWFPLALGYASMVFMRYNLNALQKALDDDKLMTLHDFGTIFSIGAAMYVVGFFTFGPLVDRKGGRWGMIAGLTGTIISNLLMALVVQGVLKFQWGIPVFWTIAVLYGANMFFQSLGAMSIVTTKMPWFHVRERGTFSTIFGVMITLGIYFAFDWGYAIKDATRAIINPDKLSATATAFREILGTGGSGINESWWLFLFPALFGLFWLIPIVFTLRNTPQSAGFAEFETGDDHVSDQSLTMRQMLKEVFLNPKHRTVLIICLIEFCSGVIRNGTMQYYPKFAESVGFKYDFWITTHWGLVLLIAGVIGAYATGWVSDKVFGSRRGPMALCLYTMMFASMWIVFFTLGKNSIGHGELITGISIFVVAMSVIGVHAILSGTAAADFTGVKNTGKAVGIVDGAVYAGTGLQSYITGLFMVSNSQELKNPDNWIAWPLIILPFTLIGMVLCLMIYNALPKGRRGH